MMLVYSLLRKPIASQNFQLKGYGNRHCDLELTLPASVVQSKDLKRYKQNSTLRCSPPKVFGEKIRLPKTLDSLIVLLTLILVTSQPGLTK